MTIKVGDKLPEANFMTPGAGRAQRRSPPTRSSRARQVALFAVPGAFTPTCSAKHLPGFKQHAAELKAKGVDTIACVSVNDVFVMKAWGEDQGVGDDILMLADGNGDFTKAIGLELDATRFGMGPRSQRYSLIVEDGVVEGAQRRAGRRIPRLVRRVPARAPVGQQSHRGPARPGHPAPILSRSDARVDAGRGLLDAPSTEALGLVEAG